MRHSHALLDALTGHGTSRSRRIGPTPPRIGVEGRGGSRVARNDTSEASAVPAWVPDSIVLTSAARFGGSHSQSVTPVL